MEEKCGVGFKQKRKKQWLSIPFNCLVEPKGCGPKTKFLTSSIKEAVTEYDKVGQSCHSRSIATDFYFDWLVSRQFTLLCLSVKGMFEIVYYFTIVSRKKQK